MIELTVEQAVAVEILAAEYDDSPWTRDELQALAWERVKHEEWDEYDDQP